MPTIKQKNIISKGISKHEQNIMGGGVSKKGEINDFFVLSIKLTLVGKDLRFLHSV